MVDSLWRSHRDSDCERSKDLGYASAKNLPDEAEFVGVTDWCRLCDLSSLGEFLLCRESRRQPTSPRYRADRNRSANRRGHHRERTETCNAAATAREQRR